MKKPLSPAAIATIIIVVIAAILVGSAGFYTDFLWFKQLGYSNVFTTQLWANTGTFALSAIVMGAAAWASLFVAFRNRPVYAQYVASDRPGLGAYRELLSQIRTLTMVVAPVALAIFAGVASLGNWKTVLLFLNKTSAGITEPQFNLDVSFYLFELPFYNLVNGFLSSVALVSLLLGLAVNIVFGAIRFTGRAVSFTKAARIQTAVSAAFFVLFRGN